MCLVGPGKMKYLRTPHLEEKAAETERWRRVIKQYEKVLWELQLQGKRDWRYILLCFNYQNCKEVLVGPLQVNLSLGTRAQWYWRTCDSKRKQTIKEVFCFAGLKTHVRKIKDLSDKWSYLKTINMFRHTLGPMGAFGAKHIVKISSVFFKELRERWVQNERKKKKR